VGLSTLINNVTVRTKLLVLVMVPLLTILVFSAVAIVHELEDYRVARASKGILDVSLALKDLAFELQKERGLSSTHTSLKQAYTLNQLNNQRELTDKKYQQYKTIEQKYKDEPGDIVMDEDHYLLLSKLEELADVRKQVDQLIDNNFFAYYSELIELSLRHLRQVEVIAFDSDLIVLVDAYTHLLAIKEQAARERGLLSAIFGLNELNSVNYKLLASHIANETQQFDEFYAVAPEKFKVLLKEKMLDPIVGQVLVLRSAALNKAESQEILGKLESYLGYGGLIHNFKNYVIRGKEQNRQRYLSQLKQVNALIESYRMLPGLADGELEYLKTIDDTLVQYYEQLEHVASMKREGASISKIDAMVKVDDGPAMNAIEHLRSDVTSMDTRNWWAIASKRIELMSDVGQQMSVAISQHVDDLIEASRQSVQLVSIGAIFVMGFTLLLTYFLIQRLAGGIGVMAEAMDTMRQTGDLEHTVDVSGKDEISRMAQAFNNLIAEREHVEQQLRDARDQAEEGIKAKSEFLSTMSHEIRTPMNGVLGMAELLEVSRLDNEQKEYVSAILNSGELLLSIINDILDFSKLEAGRVELEQIPFNMELAIDDVMQLLSVRSEEKGLELIIDYLPDSPRYFQGDPARMRQILLNLIGNAIKFTEQGHIRAGVTCDVDKDIAAITLEVEDTGVGIKAEKQKGLFESFTQEDSSTTREYGGTGLGLSICVQIVELMGGEIKIDSELGKGSTFRVNFKLPLADEPELIPQDKNLSGVPILLVDDNEINRKLYKRMLEHVGAKVEVLDRPEAALPKLYEAANEGKPFRLVIIDYNMPVQDGESLGQEIHLASGLDNLSLILFSSSGDRGDAKIFEAAGFSAYLNKPVRMDVLCDVLINVLNQHDNVQLVTRHSAAEAKKSLQQQKQQSKELEFNQQFQGHILLVEDTLVNQKVADAMLKKLGLTSDLAEDGQQAVDLWRTGNYDLILMDCRMPTMDGYQATKIIRSEEQDVRLPIIALTANASTGDCALCHSAGMDDVVTKPFRPADLIQALIKWLPAKSKIQAEQLVEQSSDIDSSDTQFVIDVDVFERMKSILGDGFSEFIDAFYQSVENNISAMESWQPSDGENELIRFPHTLKSVSANVGSLKLSELARECEALAMEGSIDQALRLLDDLKQEYEEVKDVLHQWGY